MNSTKTARSLRAGASISVLALAAPLMGVAASAHAAVTISSAATANMVCSGGTCAPTAASAVLNVGDLETLLASGNVAVTTTGSGVQAKDINVKAALAWSSTGALTLDANRSIAIDQAMSIAGFSGLTLDTSARNGTLSFGKKGHVGFADLSSALTINGAGYTLVNTIAALASAIKTNPTGDYALAAGYDASADGTYASSPVSTTFEGAFEGLGNTISHLAIDMTDRQPYVYIGLFANLGTGASIDNLALSKVNIAGPKGRHGGEIGGLVGQNLGLLFGDSVSGKVLGRKNGSTGGLVGLNYTGGAIVNCFSSAAVSSDKGGLVGDLVGASLGTISNSSATGAVKAGLNNEAGGLVGENQGTIVASYATGSVTSGYDSWVGGLVAENENSISQSYATGAVTGGSESKVGGLVGDNYASTSTISDSYSTGTVTGGGTLGGLIGYDGSTAGNNVDSYWDTTTSGITNLSQGAGNIANDPGITGLTTAQFQSGLPAGFDPSIWGENAGINGGLPYLLANPPPS